MIEKSDSSIKEPSITFPPMKAPVFKMSNPCKQGSGDDLLFQFILECRARLLETKPELSFD